MATFDPSVLHPAPDLAERELPGAARRVVAMAIDLALLVLPLTLFAVLVTGAWLYLTQRPLVDGLTAWMSDEATGADLLPLLDALEASDATRLPEAVRVALAQGHREEAAALLAEAPLMLSLQLSSATESSEHDEPGGVRVELGQLLPSGVAWVARFGLAALYFAVLGSGGRRTAGKWLTGLEVMHLSGRPPTLLEAFQRFLAYFVTVGSGVGLVALVQDRNGRANHDRMVHTVVLRRR
ncbi:MAG: RDD family protein [Alphaproteobacteria bacterium]|nr:RDD family protein [Alphaproteobacteria bacterium]MCB9690884.1 RDD family protein [Alphaproteobacteria bacterium]